MSMDKDFIISIQELLLGRGRNAEFDQTDPKRIKLIKHSGAVLANSIISDEYEGCPIYELYRNNYNKFVQWQGEQDKAMFENIDYIVVFIAEEGYQCRFVGVFKNYKDLGPSEKGLELFDIKEVGGFERLKNLVVINWGTSRKFAQGWHNDKEVIRIEQKSNKEGVPVFTRYEDVVLSYEQLKVVVSDKDWQSKLECLNCVYVILDKENGKQYVGVTYKDRKSGEKNGILWRWTQYAKSAHGDDKELVALLNKEGLTYAERNFQWSILETLPLNVTPKVAIDRESLYKEKLGTRLHGYNDN